MNDDLSDPVQSAKVVYGSLGAPGADVIILNTSAGQFNTFNSQKLTASQYRTFIDTSLSIIVSSAANPRKLAGALK